MLERQGVKLNPKERAIRDALNPRAPQPARKELELERKRERERQQWSAWRFLTTGNEKGDELTKPPYGKKWNRDYNPEPYPGCKPDQSVDRIEMYIGTGIGCVYGFMNSQQFLWQLAGWTITRKGQEYGPSNMPPERFDDEYDKKVAKKARARAKETVG